MKQKTEEYTTKLTPEAIDEFSDKIRHFLAKQKCSSNDIVRYTLTAEEILLKTADKYGENIEITLVYGIRFFRPFFAVKLDCTAYNVFAEKETEQGALGNSILKNLGLSPEYTFTGNKNVYTFKVHKKTVSPFVKLGISLILSIVVGFLGKFIPTELRTVILSNVFDPLHDTFFNILGCIAGPMIFLSVAWGIYGIGDAATLKRIGKKLLGTYIGIITVITLVLGSASLFVFDLNFSSSSGSSSELSSIISMLLGIIPKNIFSPFTEGNTLQIIFLAVIIGIAMLFLGQKTTAVAKAVEQINYIVQLLIEFISRLVPYFIFIILVSMIWADSADIFSKVIKLFAVFLALFVILTVTMTVYTALRTHTNPIALLKKGLPALLIALSTASSAAAFGTTLKSCKSQYGIDESISSFGIPLGMVIFKPMTTINYLVAALFFAELYQIKISAAWIVILFITVIILTFATPPIPGGAMTAYSILFTQLGIPAEAIAVALACDTIFDFIDTGFDIYMLPLALLTRADRLGMVDREVLNKKK